MTDELKKQSRLRPMIDADLESVLSLRNHDDIRRYMLTKHKISIEEHSHWFERALQNPGIELLVLDITGNCCGFVQFKETNFHGVLDWGFYVAPDAPKGLGSVLGQAAIKHAFKKENIYKICGQALDWNKPSVEFHKSLGFMQEGILRDQYFDIGVYHNLICFGLLKREWIAKE